MNSISQLADISINATFVLEIIGIVWGVLGTVWAAIASFLFIKSQVRYLKRENEYQAFQIEINGVVKNLLGEFAAFKLEVNKRVEEADSAVDSRCDKHENEIEKIIHDFVQRVVKTETRLDGASGKFNSIFQIIVAQAMGQRTFPLPERDAREFIEQLEREKEQNPSMVVSAPEEEEELNLDDYLDEN